MVIKNLVDNAIEVNIEDYKRECKNYYLYSDLEKSSKTKKDSRDFRHYATGSLKAFSAIEDTLIRIFPEWNEYITERLVKERLKVIDKS